MGEYKAVPVEAAKDIAEKYSKHVVIISSFDVEHNMLHTTTFGIDESQKVWAAMAGDIIAQALGSDLNQINSYEDFRGFKDTDEEFKTLEQMDQYGGSFVKELARLYRKGDPFNQSKLRRTFWDYFAKYKEGIKNG